MIHLPGPLGVVAGCDPSGESGQIHWRQLRNGLLDFFNGCHGLRVANRPILLKSGYLAFVLRWGRGLALSSGMIRRGVLHHQIFVVSDAVQSARFYEPVLRFLGYQCSGSGPNYQDWRLQVEGAPHELSFISVDPALRGIKHVRGAVGQQHHFAWAAASPREVDEFHARVLVPLAAAGDAVILDPPGPCPEYTSVYYAVFFEDPDGLKFEFVFNPPAPLP